MAGRQNRNRNKIPNSIWRWDFHDPKGLICDSVSTGNKIVAVGAKGLIRTSSDGTNWVLRQSGQTRALYGVAWSEKLAMYVAVGQRDLIIASNNGNNWETRVPYNREKGISLIAVAYGGDRFVAVGDKGVVRISNDGINWRDGKPCGKRLDAIAYHNGLFVAASSNNSIFSTKDGMSWSHTRASQTNTNLYSVCHGNGLWVVGGGHGACFTSKNGKSWIARETGTDNYLTGLIFTGKEFVACGNSDGTPQWGSMLLVSRDGKSWLREKAPSGFNPGGQPCFSSLKCNAVFRGRVFSFGARSEIISKDINKSAGAKQDPITEGTTIKVTSPKAGAKLEIGSIHKITWDTADIKGHVKIQYSLDNGATWQPLDNDTRNDGVTDWKIPGNVAGKCKIKISDVKGPASGISAAFSITTAGNGQRINIVSPRGGETFTAGSTVNLTWTSNGIPGHVKIQYSNNNGATWKAVDNDTKNDGITQWKVPNDISEQCRIRISDVRGDTAGICPGMFAIEKKKIIIPPDTSLLKPLPGTNTFSKAVRTMKQGSVVQLAVGTYLQTEPVILPPEVTSFSICGKGMATTEVHFKKCNGIRQNVAPVLRGTISGLTIKNLEAQSRGNWIGIRLRGCSNKEDENPNILIRDVAFDGTPASGMAISLSDVFGATIDNVHIIGGKGRTGRGIHLCSCVASTVSRVNLKRLDEGILLNKAKDKDIIGPVKHGCERIKILAADISDVNKGITLGDKSVYAVISQCSIDPVKQYAIREVNSQPGGSHVIDGGSFGFMETGDKFAHLIWLQNDGSSVSNISADGRGTETNGLTLSKARKQGAGTVKMIRVSGCSFQKFATGVYLHTGRKCTLVGNTTGEITNGIFAAKESKSNTLIGNIGPVINQGDNHII